VSGRRHSLRRPMGSMVEVRDPVIIHVTIAARCHPGFVTDRCCRYRNPMLRGEFAMTNLASIESVA
ncbi:MAG: hypothetical protein ABW213_09890, partial [Tardiphaga sp.]